MKSLFCSIFLALLFLGGLVLPAWAVINGAVEWDYIDLDVKNKDGNSYNVTSFFQRYSVLHRQEGLLGGGRLGSWRLGIGAEWAAFDTKADDYELDKSSYKALFDGDLLIAPGALPFRLHAFSYDLGNITTLDDAVRGHSLDTPFLRAGIPTDLNNGQTIYSGLQLVAGIRNGSYLGRYRETLSQLPRLLIDYRDIYHRDMHAYNPSKYRQRDLAFVSLNKKDNWFHYRVFDYKDYIDNAQSERQETFLLGTIDHTLKRQWIHLTNWVQISTDGSYTTTNDETGMSEKQRYNVNFFTTMQRRNLAVANFTSYSRERQGDRLSQSLDIPLYMNNRINPDVNLRGQLVANSWKEQYGDKVWDDDNIYYSTAKYETNITRKVRIDYGLEAEYSTGQEGTGQGLRGEVEAYSNLLNRSRFNWYGNVGLGHFGGDGLDGIDTDYWETFGAGRVNYALNSRLTLEGTQELVFGNGSIGVYSTSYLVPRSTRGFTSVAGEVSRDDHYFRSQTGLALEHVGRNRLTNRVAGLYKYEEDSQNSNWAFELEHRLTYNARAFNAQMKNIYTTGDFTGNSETGTSALGNYQEINSPDDVFKTQTFLTYLPNKYWEAGFDLDVEWRRGNSNLANGRKTDTTLILLTQRLQRNFYAINGVIRKLADIEERIDYQRFIDGADSETVAFSLAGNYYPTKILSFGGRFLYNYWQDGSDNMTFTLTSGLHFPKFQVDFDYGYGTDKDRRTVVQRYELNVRKTF